MSGGQVVTSTAEVQALVRRAQAHDTQAYAALYELYSRKIYSYLFYHLNGHAHDAEDLTAEVFLKVFEKIGSYEFRGAPFSTWLFRIAHNHLIDYIRGRPRRPPVSLEETSGLHEPSAPHELDRWLTADQLRGALARLTKEQSRVIVLRFIEGLSIAETARVMRRSEDAAKKLQARGLAALRRVLEGER